MQVKEQNLALSSGMGLAGLAVSRFWEDNWEIFNFYKEEIISIIIKPQKETAIHYYLFFYQDIEEDVSQMESNIDDMQEIYQFIVRTLKEVDIYPNMTEPDFDNCGDDNGHRECECTEIIENWMNYLSRNNVMIDELIIHSAFQFIFQDRNFLHDFHFELSKFIERELDYINEKYPDYVTQKNKLKRQKFPVWLKRAVFYRDKGTCVVCSCDLSNLVRTQNQIHIDHIIPLNMYGTNDSSNMQLLCNSCNTKKGDRSTTTNSVNVPFWNF